MRKQLKTRNTGIDGRLPNHYSNFHIWKIGSYIYVTFLNTISINNLYTLKIISFRAIQREIYILKLSSKCFQWLWQQSLQKKNGNKDCGVFSAIFATFIPTWTNYKTISSDKCSRFWEGRLLDAKKFSGSALQAWIRGRYYASVKRPCRELVPRRLTSALGDVCCGPERSIVR